MNTNKKIINVLQEIAKTGVITPSSIEKLSLDEQELIKNLHKNGLIHEALSFTNSINVDDNWETFKKSITVKEKKPIPLWKKAYKYAAVFILLLTCSYFVLNKLKVDNTKVNVASGAIELILENGDKQILNTNNETKIVKQNGEVIGSQKGDILNYKPKKTSEKLVYNQLRVPYGKTFNLFLSDGTKVYLNSGTTLKYPVNFIKGKKREVFLKGEAYFEVAKDTDHPFIVNANEMNVTVLGTKFNVSSYTNDSEISTVLVEGSVSLSSDIAPNESSLLEPGYKGTLNTSQSNKIALQKVDTRIYTEWMNGDVIFRNSTFAEITKKLERNYNVIIDNNYTELNMKKFNASFNKKIENIDDIMISIGKIHLFTYEKIDNKIIINP